MDSPQKLTDLHLDLGNEFIQQINHILDSVIYLRYFNNEFHKKIYQINTKMYL